ncbi:MAG: ATP-binding cassette domain-containing protein [Actinomycetes bacterium]
MSVVGFDQTTQRGLEIVARDIHVSYDGHEVLRSVDLRVEPGRMVAVTGPSGAGKTTLLWVLAALVLPGQGEIVLGGETPRTRDQTSAAGVVLIPQDNALATVLTAAENVLVPLLAAKVRPDEAQSRTSAALEAVGLAGAGDQLVEELSGGQQQRVAVARGLAQRGHVVLADEPTSELDAVNRGRIVALLRAEADRGAAVVLATHDPDAAAECDAELHLDAGEATWVRH